MRLAAGVLLVSGMGEAARMGAGLHFARCRMALEAGDSIRRPLADWDRTHAVASDGEGSADGRPYQFEV